MVSRTIEPMRGENEMTMNVQLESLWPSNAAACSRARLSYRPWSFDETRRLKRFAGNLSVPEIAQVLRRSEKSIVGKAQAHGISLVQYGQKSHAAKYPDSVVEFARRLHSKGWSPRRINAKYGWPISIIKQWVYYQTRLSDPIKLS